MPKAASRQTITRQWELLKLLPSIGNGLTATELTNRLNELQFSVTKRTVERDLLDLSSLFGIYCNDESKPYQWRWMDGGGANLPGITMAEALSVQIIEDVVRPLLPTGLLQALESKFSQSRTKLKEMMASNALAQWPRKIRVRESALPLLPPEIDWEVLRRVQNSLLKDVQLTVEYLNAEGEELKQILLHPLGLVQRGAISYLVATAYVYDDVRLYAIHRIKSARLLDDKVSKPKDFSLDKYINQGALEFGTGKTIKLKARIHEELARYLLETPLTTDMEIIGEGDWLTLKATINDTVQLRWWILSQGHRFEVIAPVRLRREITEELELASAMYS